ncbi:type VII secretion-associated protein, partial [Nocardia farcinica]|uniref:type VII secretion-associated protein n=1 Tax=Nocardia farcinica TaxID=37329 RepID=UPI0024559B14
PDDGSRLRLTVTQTRVAADAGVPPQAPPPGGPEAPPPPPRGPAPAATPSPAPPPATTSSAAAAPATHTLGPVTFRVPDGWHVTSPGATSARVDLGPDDGSRLRLTVTQTRVAADAGYARIAADLEAQMQQKPSLGDLRRDVVFAGRSGLSYIERPQGGSTVRWHVLLEHGTQVSIGCQYVAEDDWAVLEPSCEELATSIDVQP